MAGRLSLYIESVRDITSRSMDSEQIRFRIDKAIRAEAERTCAALGLDLVDVLRTVVHRIARDGALPFDLNRTVPSAADARPFADYDPRLWSALNPSLQAEVAAALIRGCIAECSRRLEVQRSEPVPDERVMVRLGQYRSDAQSALRALGTADAGTIASWIEHYRGVFSEDES